MHRKNFPGRREKRRLEALERQEVCSSLTLEQRIALCDVRPGSSRKERARLAAMLAVRDAPKLDVQRAEKAPPKTDKKAIKARERKEKGDT